MVAIERARKIQRVGHLIIFYGVVVGIAVWLFGFRGDLSRSAYFFSGRWS